MELELVKTYLKRTRTTSIEICKFVASLVDGANLTDKQLQLAYRCGDLELIKYIEGNLVDKPRKGELKRKALCSGNMEIVMHVISMYGELNLDNIWIYLSNNLEIIKYFDAPKLKHNKLMWFGGNATLDVVKHALPENLKSLFDTPWSTIFLTFNWEIVEYFMNTYSPTTDYCIEKACYNEDEQVGLNLLAKGCYSYDVGCMDRALESAHHNICTEFLRLEPTYIRRCCEVHPEHLRDLLKYVHDESILLHILDNNRDFKESCIEMIELRFEQIKKQKRCKQPSR
jgi:hypothetical protein